jgi:excinuclease ABC subunit A
MRWRRVTFFASEPAMGGRSGLADLGLGYPARSVSDDAVGGEAQRIKIATERSTLQRSKHTVYIPDEPTTGFIADVERLLGSLNRLVDAGQHGDAHRASLDVSRPPTT